MDVPQKLVQAILLTLALPCEHHSLASAATTSAVVEGSRGNNVNELEGGTMTSALASGLHDEG